MIGERVGREIRRLREGEDLWGFRDRKSALDRGGGEVLGIAGLGSTQDDVAAAG